MTSQPINNLLMFGGSFDPIHLGHLHIAQAVQNHFHFERFLFIPCKKPVLGKQLHIEQKDRIHLIEAGIKDYPDFQLDLREVARNTPSYTIDTLKSLRSEHPSPCALVLMLGMDSFQDLQAWYQWRSLLQWCHILLLQRPGFQISQLSDTMQTFLNEHATKDEQDLLTKPNGNIYLFNAGAYPISSTLIRQALAHQQPVEHYLPLAVAEYIQKKQLYR